MRAFIAIELPEELKNQLFQLTKSFPKKWDIKLVEKENLHLTLLFLGVISEKEKEKIVQGLGELKKFGEIKLSSNNLEFFPNSYQREGIWLEVGGGKEKLFSLYKKIVDEILNLGINFKNGSLRFSPHIALGRFRCQPSFDKLGGFKEDFWVKNFVLFESKLGRRGPTYIKIASFGL